MAKMRGTTLLLLLMLMLLLRVLLRVLVLMLSLLRIIHKAMARTCLCCALIRLDCLAFVLTGFL